MNTEHKCIAALLILFGCLSGGGSCSYAGSPTAFVPGKKLGIIGVVRRVIALITTHFQVSLARDFGDRHKLV